MGGSTWVCVHVWMRRVSRGTPRHTCPIKRSLTLKDTSRENKTLGVSAHDM